MSIVTTTDRSRVRRLPARASYEREAIFSILDEGLVCQIGFVVDGKPFVIPTTYARSGELLYIHGSPASRMLRTLATGVELCLSVTLLDGLVLARSAFHHSMNYRSAVVFGTARVVEGEEKRKALQALVEHVIPGRSKEVREASEEELRRTLVLALPVAEASAKVRTGPPVDDEPDYALQVWAGELPFAPVAGAPRNDPRLDLSIDVPDYVLHYTRTFGRGFETDRGKANGAAL